MFAMWTLTVAVRWFSAVSSWHWKFLWPASAVLELAVALLRVAINGTPGHPAIT